MFGIFIAIILLMCFITFIANTNDDDNLDSLVNERIQNRTKGIEKETEEILEELEEELEELEEELEEYISEEEKKVREKIKRNNYAVDNYVTLCFNVTWSYKIENILNTYYKILNEEGINFEVTNISICRNGNTIREFTKDLLITIKVLENKKDNSNKRKFI